MVPAEQHRYDSVLRFLLGAAALCVILFMLHTLRGLFAPFLQATFVAIIASYPVSFLERRRVPRAVGSVLMVLLILIVALVTASLVGAGVASAGSDLAQYDAKLEEFGRGIVSWVESYGLELSPDILDSLIQTPAIVKFAGGLAREIGGRTVQAFFVMLIAIYFLLDAPQVGQRMERISRGKKTASGRAEGYTTIIYRYLTIKTLASIGTGLTVGILLALLGVRHASLWGLLALLLNFIPQVGSLIAAIPPIALALLTMGPFYGLGTLVVFVIANFIFGNVVEPRLLGERFGLPVALILFSLALWGWVFGVTGVFLAVPLTMAVLFALERTPETRRLAHVLGGSNFESEEPS
jgi:AI-2 transport protein TqsA